MPLRDRIVYCINHPQTPMVRNEGVNALIQVSRPGPGQVAFNPSVGVPVALFFCDTCGYTELYVAVKVDAAWQPQPPGAGGQGG